MSQSESPLPVGRPRPPQNKVLQIWTLESNPKIESVIEGCIKPEVKSDLQAVCIEPRLVLQARSLWTRVWVTSSSA